LKKLYSEGINLKYNFRIGYIFIDEFYKIKIKESKAAEFIREIK